MSTIPTDKYKLLAQQSSDSYEKTTSNLGIKSVSDSDAIEANIASLRASVSSISADTPSYNLGDTGKMSTAEKISSACNIASAAASFIPVGIQLAEFISDKTGGSKEVTDDNALNKLQSNPDKTANRKAVEKEVIALQNQQTSLTSTIASYGKQIDEAKAQLDTKQQTDTATAEITRLKAEAQGGPGTQAAGFMEQSEKAEADSKNVGAQISEIESSCSEQVSQRNILTGEKANAESQLSSLNVSGKQSDVSVLGSKLRLAKQAKPQNKENITAIQSQLDKAKEALKNAEQQEKDLKKTIETINDKIDDLNASMEKGGKNVKDLKAQQEQYDTQAKQYKDKATQAKSSAESQANSLQEQIDSGFAKQKETANATLKEAEANKAKYEQELRDTNRKLDERERALGTNS